MISNLIDVIAKTSELTALDIEQCSKYFEEIEVSKNTILEKQNKVPKYIYFVSTGFMRLFYNHENGDETTTFLRPENGFITSFLPFINQIGATENVQAVTDCRLLRITNPDMKKLIAESENFKQFSLIIFEEAMSSATTRANDLATLSAEQRYRKLMNDQPEVIQNIPIQYIASYLGVKSQSLSRIRANLIK